VKTLTLAILSSVVSYSAFAQNASSAAAQDWAQTLKYREANREVRTTGAEVDAVFIGDSITESWLARDGKFFVPGRLDRGISGQTTRQILFRFQQDVVDLHPITVHIMAGTNDIAQNMGLISVEQIARNIENMAETALRSGIRVVIGSVLPCDDFFWHHGLQPSAKIRKLNQILKIYAAKKGLVFADYAAAMDDGRGGLRSDLGIDKRSDGQEDEVHPNAKGYQVMDPIAEKALRQAAGEAIARESRRLRR
jgi:lysophospholipase L1-like esterase